MENLTQKEIWNKIAPEWNKFRQKPMQNVIEFLKDKKGKILDLGCGSGRHLIKLQNTIFYEVDFSEEMINFAKENSEKKQVKAEFLVSDSSSLPFESNFFDYAIFAAALHCIDSEEKRKESLKELFRVLKPDAEALVLVWSKNHIKTIKHQEGATIAWKKNSEELQRYNYLYDKDELENLLKEVGFKITSSKEDNKNISIIIRK